MRIAFDTGGTFTDCVYLRDGRIEILKIPSTPQHPADAIGEALKQILASGSEGSPLDLVCGTTVGTNALLQRRGGRVALVTTLGFEGVLEIGRQNRPRLYDLLFEKPEPLVPRARRFGLKERLDYRGRVLVSPMRAEITRTVRAVVRSGAKSVAVCLLFSFVNPVHEKAIARALTRAGLEVSASYQILPEYREFERTSTTVVNAYLVPVMSDYLGEIEEIANKWSRRGSLVASQRARVVSRFVGRASREREPTIRHDNTDLFSSGVLALGGAKQHFSANPPAKRRQPGRAGVRVMQSNGGVLSARAAAREPVRTILSGPAGGVLGAQYVSEVAGFDRIITLDMGGTSTDVSLMEVGNWGSLATTSESIVSGVPVAVPMLDIHTVGAGGGSLARFDRAGALRVGPESAGVDPGPICYGRGTQPTVTDANLVLGRLPESGLLGGAFALDARRARQFMNQSRGPMHSVEEFAQGIVDVANAVMGKAVRVISVERGYDTRDYTLVAFGGAGALHACDLAAALDIPRVLVPCFPGALSALGILRADVRKDLTHTVRMDVRGVRELQTNLRQAFATMERQGRAQMQAEGFMGKAIQIERALDMRYSGQSYDLTVLFDGDVVAAFHRGHEKRYGYSDRTRPCEVVNIRARFTGRTPKPALPKWKPGGPSARVAAVTKSILMFAGRRYVATTYDRARLRAGNRIGGPAIVTEYSATTFIPPHWSGHVDHYGNILLELAR